MGVKNFGILASMSWNSNKWAAPASEEDLARSNYEFVKENELMHEDLNFAHEILPCEKNGKFVAYTPMFNKMPSPTVSKDVAIIFLRSLNYMTKQNFIVGFYAFPTIKNVDRKADHKLFYTYNSGNVASLPQNIVQFEFPIEISDEISLKENYLPRGKKIGKQGFNYLTIENVLAIFDSATNLNLSDEKTKKIKLIFLRDPKYKL